MSAALYKRYFDHLRQKVELSQEDEELIKKHLYHQHLNKKEFLLHEGQPCIEVAFVAKGFLRVYSVDTDQVDHIVQFAPENWLASDLFSFITGENAIYNIDAIEKSELILMSKASHEELLNTSVAYEKFIRIQITNAYVALQRRVNSNLSLSIQERYESFLKLHGDIALRVPQHMIASYLGLAPETLSRVRKKMSENE
ncbi:Crp/Fnr family transcriptional regulator [Fulvivirga ligni]|uniref:Crp/Fnr family transcriptional regulator n=1 Tax=Fulvivirga ligni TaxID=2904246 RepID=UPI001F242758|nr:Crp/Fnr family transcriptional regulator [Fulvivirga ligni]UII23721.1 Crp/Fnr family transcriptional regulator [Fulvivirga ligni]